ncbi:MAG: thiol-disulfide isomerase/thioredoxin [Crocinitomicaceae bacterium]|jgi:thiol-disulfide isomerase/thioredoxin
MKKQLLLGAIVLASAFSSSAQIADGSTAPDFTGTDQWGNSHTLSNYTAQGKTVILDVFATWCGPCWNYHQAHILKQLWEAYGPDGSDEIMIFGIEADASTTTADLEGTGGNTTGDWLEGTPYPMIDAASIGNAYQITYYPTLFRVCPDGLVFEEGQSNVSAWLSSIASNCSQTLTGASNHASLDDSEVALCSTDGAPSFDFSNFGTNAITSASIDLLENGSVVATAPYSGNLAQFAVGSVTFPTMTINGGSTYTAEITAINGGSPFNGNITTSDLSVVSATTTGYSINVDFFTDNYPGETSWEIISSGGVTVASGGPYTPGTDDAFGAGGPDAQTTISSTHTLPNGVDCYSVKFTDAYGDGQQYGTGTNPQGGFGIQVESLSNVIFNWDGGSGWSDIERDAAMKTDGSSEISEISIENLSIFPNPASEVLNVNFTSDSEYTVSILDLQGRVLATQLASNNVTFQVADLASGSYLVTISTENGVHTENVVIK